jgi:hypothetical protein
MSLEYQAKTWVWEDSSLCPETSTKNAVQEFHLKTNACRYWKKDAELSLSVSVCVFLSAGNVGRRGDVMVIDG